MKRTELERRERELKKSAKKVEVLERKQSGDRSVNDFINELAGMFRHDMEEIFNTTDDLNILEFLEGMKDELAEKHWDNVLRKAIKKTGVAQKDKAFDELKELLIGQEEAAV